MLRTTIDKAYLKRTIRPLYGWTQATPKSCFLDAAWDRSKPIWPGMAMARTTGENYTLIGSSMDPSGLCDLYIGGDGIDELLEQGINALAVWVLGPDAEMEILAPAFDSAVSWNDSVTAGVDVLVHARLADSAPNTTLNTGLRGQLVPAGTSGSISTRPVARLMKVESATKIIVGGLRGTI